VTAAQIGHLDLDVIDGDFPAAAEPPLVPGTEGAGVVVASAAFPVGARVRVRGGGVGLGRDGTWAEYVRAPDPAVYPIPDGAPDWLACCYFSPACTAWAAVRDVAAVRAGERVLVTGASGAVGRLAVQLAGEAGAEVVGVVGRPAKLAHVPAPASAVLVTDAAELAGFDVLIDTVGGHPFEVAMSKLRDGGRAAVIGYAAGRHIDMDLQRFIFANAALLPVNLLQRGPGLIAVGDALLARLSLGELSLPVRRVGPDGLARAAAALRSGEIVGKLALVWDAA
jgi:NADPH:quinone reductase